MMQNEDFTKPLTIFQLIKLGAGLGIAWGLIFWGCLVNIPKPFLAGEIALVLFIIILGMAFTAPVWMYQLKDFLKEPKE